ncbi:hypothetical protein COU80_00830 [Candidatus Peregrinibacteria bacterium CG10_big_fil_rev_8_21_14_0_10_55_24]|nr:MAG: hypothetical protein COU80_00830 [Candidatus Peregrinibacteria bacterium CG10_big_fil_rev_8_21_14_0_10_55_24]
MEQFQPLLDALLTPLGGIVALGFALGFVLIFWPRTGQAGSSGGATLVLFALLGLAVLVATKYGQHENGVDGKPDQTAAPQDVPVPEKGTQFDVKPGKLVLKTPPAGFKWAVRLGSDSPKNYAEACEIPVSGGVEARVYFTSETKGGKYVTVTIPSTSGPST